MKRNYVLIFKATHLTPNQAAILAAKCMTKSKQIAPQSRNILGLETKGGK